jgi:hypothetical protein
VSLPDEDISETGVQNIYEDNIEMDKDVYWIELAQDRV